MSTIAIGAVAVVSVAIAGILFAHRPKKRAYVTSGIDHNQQSVVLPGAERIHRSPAAKDKFISYAYPDATTLYEALLRGIKQTPNGSGNFLGTRAGDGPYTWQSYAEVHQRALNLGAGLLSLGVKPGQSTYVGIYSQNRAEWIISEHACNAYSMITVPLYDTLGAEAVEFIVNQAGVSVILCDEPKIKGLFSLISSKKLSPVKIIVKFSQVSEAEAEEAAKLGVQLISIVAAEKKGQASPVAPIPPKPSDIATICYTSGTTGDPKGAMLTHGNLIADCGGVMYLVRQSNLPDPLIGPDDIHVSYLPLAHMFERIVAVWLTQSGGQIGFFRGDIKLLMNDIGTLRPTIFCSVPRLLNRVYDRVSAGVKASSGLKQALFNYGLKSKEVELEAGIIRNDSIWDKVIFKKVQATLGGRVKFVVTGSAPISKTCLQFLRCVLGCPIIEGYGQTECSAAGTISLLGDTMSAGTVGAVIPCGEIKLATVPDSKYLAENDEGEVCFRGPHVFKGYLNNPERTAEALDADGWLHSGDIGKWDEKGRLRIIDRKKAIFKLSQGEYIAPEKIENIYVRATSVAQVFVYGDSLQSVLVAIVVPDIEVMPTWLPKNVPDLSPNASLSDICKDPRVNALILKEMLAEGAQAKLASFEQVKAIHLSSTPFTVENNQLTPTFKSKRPQLTEAYRSVVDQLYQKIDQTQASSAN